MLWRESSLERVRACGRVARVEQIGVRAPGPASGGRAGFSGLATCGSPWACPVCAAKIAAERAGDLGHVLAWATREGHTAAMVTFTMRHNKGHSLRECWDALTAAWSSVTSGKAWAGESVAAYDKRLRKWEGDRANDWKGSRPRPRPERTIGLVERFGVVGFARALEVTYGRNGWHVHLHVVMVLRGQASPDVVRVLGDLMYGPWSRALGRRGFDVARQFQGEEDGKGGVHTRTAADAETWLAAYLAKQLALEATHGHAKTGRNDSRTPFELLADVVEHADADALDRWHEFEEVSRGRKQLTWSEGLREMAGLAVEERTDEEIAADEQGGDADVLLLDSDAWRQVRNEQVDLLEAAEHGTRSALAWLDIRGITYTITPAGLQAIGAKTPTQTTPRRGKPTPVHKWEG